MDPPTEHEKSYDDFIRPGEKGFTSFPKQLPEDCVYYTIHVLNDSISTSSALRSRLVEIRNAATALAKSLLGDYIWQRESFGLTLFTPLDGPATQTESSSSDGKNGKRDGEEILHLQGETSFGDSVADEWLIVYLLRELSKKFADAWIRVWDADGEFLLVEAANVLPKWLNPEVAEHRVWINSGELRIIPRYAVVANTTPSQQGNSKSTKPQTPRILALHYALNYIKTHNTAAALLRDPAMESEAFHRIRNYPADIASSMHRSLISIPRKLAYILHRCPAHISPAVEAFYLRDPIALRPLRNNNSRTDQPLRFPPQDLVEVAVKFTRVGFAQLRGQEFAAPRAWRKAVSDAADGVAGRARKEMGMKLACGFEMLLADPANVGHQAVREIELLLEDLESGDETLPDDGEVATWDGQVDGEGWLDVDFEQFEKELAGRSAGEDGAADGDAFSGFGDKSAQENLRRMVERFGQLLKDNEDGDDSEDEMDYDDDDDDEEDEDDDESRWQDETEDAMQPRDEERFTSMIQQLGLPVEAGSSQDQDMERRVWEVGSEDESEEAGGELREAEEMKEMKKAMEQMEAELREWNVFDKR